MAHMVLEITLKGCLVSVECSKCGCTIHAHEWADERFNFLRELFERGLVCCPECGGFTDASTFWESPSRNYYAARYTAPGYLDCTPWEYGTNRRTLLRELRALYG
jgi:NAD-dependent SIR2 family protein deacetylase